MRQTPFGAGHDLDRELPLSNDQQQLEAAKLALDALTIGAMDRPNVVDAVLEARKLIQQRIHELELLAEDPHD